MTRWLNVNEIFVEKWRCCIAQRLAVRFYCRWEKQVHFGSDFIKFSRLSSFRSDLCSGGNPWCIWWRWWRSGCWCSPGRKAEWRNHLPRGEWREWIVCHSSWAPGQTPVFKHPPGDGVCVDLFIRSRHLISSSCLSASLNTRALPQAWRNYHETSIVPLTRFTASLDSVFRYGGMIF